MKVIKFKKIKLSRIVQILIWLGIYICLTLAFYHLSGTFISSKEINTQALSLSAQVDDKIDVVLGKSDAPITLVIYADFASVSTASTHTMLAQLAKNKPDSVRYVFRQMPLTNLHPKAEKAARAAEAANKQKKFWEMADKLFVGQASWNKLEDPTDEFVKYATDLKLNTKQFTADYDSEETKSKILQDYYGGLSSGIKTVPVVFLNGTEVKLPLNSYNELNVFIEDELEKLKSL